ncbi:HPr-rel-A system PqqD family peptide chaperone [Methylomonas rosea]|uniref:HPr-rel-A system PqqD family peptide chaperone n=1 Tax=Methylomonas rosea TaxID=2952227 RepID=A0ABT1TT39_9GAMM|nr:HPr-rel-A system PqqD family peptide chaperone [Methylomonas sp. WSC-7]
MKWNICQHFRVQLLVFDDQVVLFHHGSGETHLLDRKASFILSIILDSKAPITESVLRIRAIDEGVENFDQQSLTGILDALQNLQIIKKI